MILLNKEVKMETGPLFNNIKLYDQFNLYILYIFYKNFDVKIIYIKKLISNIYL